VQASIGLPDTASTIVVVTFEPVALGSGWSPVPGLGKAELQVVVTIHTGVEGATSGFVASMYLPAPEYDVLISYDEMGVGPVASLAPVVPAASLLDTCFEITEVAAAMAVDPPIAAPDEGQSVAARFMSLECSASQTWTLKFGSGASQYDGTGAPVFPCAVPPPAINATPTPTAAMGREISVENFMDLRCLI